MNYIDGYCRTNLYGYDVSEVKKFAAVPRLGEKVECKYQGRRATLTVCDVTHRYICNDPYIEVELSNNVAEYNFYHSS